MDTFALVIKGQLKRLYRSSSYMIFFISGIVLADALFIIRMMLNNDEPYLQNQRYPTIFHHLTLR